MKKLIVPFSILMMLAILPFVACLPEEDDGTGDPRDKFLGTWKVDETCSRMNYIVTISYDPSNSSQVLISNFGNPGPGYDPAVALVTGNSIYVSSQTIGPSWTANGSGVYISSSETVDWNYTLKIGGNLLQCSATYSR